MARLLPLLVLLYVSGCSEEEFFACIGKPATGDLIYFGSAMNDASVGCVNCHRERRDGGPDISGPEAKIGVSHSAITQLGAHPVGSNYQAAKNFNPKLNLREIADLDERIVLVDGTVQCATCHTDHTAGETHDTALPMKASELCFACHAM